MAEEQLAVNVCWLQVEGESLFFISPGKAAHASVKQNKTKTKSQTILMLTQAMLIRLSGSQRNKMSRV